MIKNFWLFLGHTCLTAIWNFWIAAKPFLEFIVYVYQCIEIELK